MNINFVISEANKILSQANIRYSKLDSEILLSKVLNKERDYIILNSNKELNKESYSLFKQLINLTLHRLEEFLEGEAFDEIIESLTLQAQEESLNNLK